ncbi:MAG: TetR/AcrR family transcriptional regulator [Akkermansiaceae bacterium]|nr:TetR/AcrR family transcriptional regulator [Akkermansiaceae bacterium]
MQVRRKQPEETRQSILAAAGEVFGRCGYAGGALADIVTAAGLTKGALFHHFPDKRSLALAWIGERLATEIAGLWLEPLAQMSSLDELKRHCQMRIGGLSGRDATLTLVALAAELGVAGDETLAGALDKLFADWQTAVAGVLERGREAGGVFRSVKPAVEAVLLVATLAGMAVTVGRSSESAKHQAATSLGDYLDTLRAQD